MNVPETFCVKIHNLNIEDGCCYGYDWYDKTLDDLENNYVIWGTCIVLKSDVKKFLKLSDFTELCWMHDDMITEIDARELFNFELVSQEDIPAFEYCKKIYFKNKL